MRAAAFVGRVGVLAVALGIGAAGAGDAAVVWASPAGSSSSDGSGDAGATRGARGSRGASDAAPSRPSAGGGVEGSVSQSPARARRGAAPAPDLRAPAGNDFPEADPVVPAPKPVAVPQQSEPVLEAAVPEASVAPVRSAASLPVAGASAGVLAAVAPSAPGVRPAGVAAVPSPAKAVSVQARPGVLQSLLGPLFGADPTAPAQGPLGWVVLAAVRRRDGQAQVATAAAVTTGQAAIAAPAATTSNPVAYIADFPNNAVIAVDTVTYAATTITKDIGRGPAGLAVNPAGTLALVPSMGDCVVSVVDTAKGAVTQVIPISKTPVNVVFNTDGSRAYVISQGGLVDGAPANGFVSVIDTATNTAKLTGTSYAVGQGPAAAAVNGNKLYVVNNAGDSVSLIDTAANTVKTIPVGFAPQGVAFSKDGNRAYVTNAGDNSVSVIDTAKGEVASTISVFRSPWSVAVTPTGKLVVSNLNDNSVSVISGSALNLSTPIPIGGMPGQVAVSPAGDRAYVTHGPGSTPAGAAVPAGVAIIDLSTNKVVKDLPVGRGPGALAIGAGIATPPPPALPTVGVASDGGGSVSDGKPGDAVKANFTVTLSATPTSEVKVSYATQDGSAKAGRDFTATTGTVTFAKGTTTLKQTIAVPVIGNTVQDGTRTFTVVLSNPVQAKVSTATAQFSILDDDAPPVGGVSSVPVAVSWPGRTGYEVRNNSAFAALRDDGTVLAWGDKANGGDSSGVAGVLDPKKPVAQIYSSSRAFAALRRDGSVVTWGSADAGGSSTAVMAALNDPAKPVVQISSTDNAFAALRSDGSVVTWGSPSDGGDSSKVATALNGAPGPVGAVGDPDPNARKIAKVVSTGSAFAALTRGGAVVTWGRDGGDSSKVTAQLNDPKNPVIAISSTKGAFAALRSDNSVITWGPTNQFDTNKKPIDYGANSSAVASQLGDRGKPVTRIYSNGFAFAALRSDGSVVTWGAKAAGGGASVYSLDTTGAPVETSVASQLSGGVTQIYSTVNAFAAVKSDGTLVTWGGRNSGGSGPASVGKGAQIVATDTAFAALTDGKVVSWGLDGGNSSGVANQLAGGVKQIYANGRAFAAVKTDGSVVTWGTPGFGGDSSAAAVAGKIRGAAVNTNPVTQIFTTGSAFAALLKDNTVVTWGNTAAGGESSSVATALTRVVSFADPFRDDRLGASANVAPTITQAVGANPNSNGTTGGSVSATDLNGDTMTMTATVPGTAGTVTVAAPATPGQWAFTFTPLNNQVRHAAAKIGAISTAPVTVTVTDAKGASTTQIVPVKIAPLNQAPIGGSFANGTPAAATGTVTGTISGVKDADNDPLSYTVAPGTTTTGVSRLGGAVTIVDNKNGTVGYTYTPTSAARRNATSTTTDNFTVVAADGYGGSREIAVTVTVLPQPNRAPQAGTPTRTTNPATGQVTGTVNAVDPDGDTTTYTPAPASTPLKSTKGATVTVDSAGKFVYTPTDPMRREAARLGGNPADSFTVKVTDSRGTSANISVPITILGKNADPQGPAAVKVTKTVTSTGVVEGQVSGATGTDPGDVIAYTATAARATTITTAKGATVTVYSDGKFVYTPTADTRDAAAKATNPADRADTFTIFATDGYGGKLAIPVKVDINPAPKQYSVTKLDAGLVKDPRASHVDNGKLYVADAAGLKVVDLATNKATLLDASLAGKVQTIVASGNRGYVITDGDSPRVLVIDTDPTSKTYKGILHSISLTEKLGLPRLYRGATLSLSPNGESLFVTPVNQGFLEVNDVLVIAAKANPPTAAKVAIRTGPTGQQTSELIAVDAKTAYVARNPVQAGVPTQVWMVDSKSNTRAAINLESGSKVEAMVHDPNFSRLYVATTTERGGQSVAVIDTNRLSKTYNTVIATIPMTQGNCLAGCLIFSTTGEGIKVSPDGRRVYITNQTGKTLSVIDTDPSSATRNTVIARIPGFDRPGDITISGDGATAYVTSWGSTGYGDGYMSAVALAPTPPVAKPPTVPSPPPNPPAGGGGGGGGGEPPPPK